MQPATAMYVIERRRRLLRNTGNMWHEFAAVLANLLF